MVKDKIINILALNNPFNKMTNKYCVYHLKCQNPDWKIKYWTEKDEKVTKLLKSDFVATWQKNEKNFSPIKEFIKLSLMKDVGGLWAEIDQIFTIAPDFDESYSYLFKVNSPESLYSFGPVTWQPVFINHNDEKINSHIQKSIDLLSKCAPDFYSFSNYMRRNQYAPEFIFQSFFNINKYAFDALLKESLSEKEAVEFFIDEKIGSFSEIVKTTDGYFYKELLTANGIPSSNRHKDSVMFCFATDLKNEGNPLFEKIIKSIDTSKVSLPNFKNFSW